MLHILLERGLRPGLIIQEISPLAFEERSKFLTRIAGQREPPSLADLASDANIASHSVSDHNDATCCRLLSEFRPKLIVLGGTRILRPQVVDIPTVGTLNAHPGLLPDLRGSSSVAWAIYLDLPIGSTVHLVDTGIDTGPILLKRRLPVRRGETYEQIVRRVLTLSGELMAEVLQNMQAGEPQPTPQDPGEGRTLRVIPPALLVQAKQQLASQGYGHFDD
jgi:methionyl-tRNA formyltransferase